MEVLEQRLLGLAGTTVDVAQHKSVIEPNPGDILLGLSNGAHIRAAYWRTFHNGKACYTSFDHGEKYGLSAPIDAIAELRALTENISVLDIRLDRESGDLILRFANGTKLQLLNLTGNEDYEIQFPDNYGEYSNYLK